MRKWAKKAQYLILLRTGQDGRAFGESSYQLAAIYVPDILYNKNIHLITKRNNNASFSHIFGAISTFSVQKHFMFISFSKLAAW